mgnify:CR=1 FL=1
MLNSHKISSSARFMTEKMSHVTLNVSFSELFKWHNSSDCRWLICNYSIQKYLFSKMELKLSKSALSCDFDRCPRFDDRWNVDPVLACEF